MFYIRANQFRIVFMVTVFWMLACNISAAGEPGNLALSKALSQAKIFAGLNDSERDALKSAATLRHMKVGERLTRRGMVLDTIFIVLDGQAEVWVNGKFITSQSGQFLIGETEFLLNIPVFADVIILKETDLIELNNAVLTDLMEKKPRIGFVLMREIALIEAQRLRATTMAGSTH